jgi:hypothetical protein
VGLCLIPVGQTAKLLAAGSAIVVTTTAIACVAVLSAHSSTTQACRVIPASTVAEAVDAPTSVQGGTFAMEGSGSGGGCLYNIAKAGYPTVEAIVFQHGARSVYEQNWQGELSSQDALVRDESGPGYRAYQSSVDTAVLVGGTYVDVELTQPGTGDSFLAANLPRLLPDLRTAALATLGVRGLPRAAKPST